LSTVILLTSVTLWFAGRLVQRLSRLQQGVKAIAAGNFETEVPERGNDEVGQLGIAVTQMSRQLSQMRTRLQRQQGEKLLHQLAGGLAHQLRNSLTGARMAIELHGRQCDSQDNSLEIAVSQLEQTEDHVRRLLTVASGRQEDDQPQAVGDCLGEAMKTLTATAKHLKVQVDFQVESNLEPLVVRDGPSLHAAVNNLVLNAFHEGNHVTVSAALQRDEALTHDVETQRLAELLVVDDGPGPPKQVANEIFEPFVTSKPEGLGLGLPLVARTAGRLGGQVSWDRDHGKTRFRMTFQVAQRGL
jgi:signal transduction histidine kinase